MDKIQIRISLKISVSEALRRKEGYVKVKGQVIGYSQIYNMVYEVTINCSNCGFFDKLDYFKTGISIASKRGGQVS